MRSSEIRLLSTLSSVPLAQRIALTCRTDVLRLEVSSKTRIRPLPFVDLKVKGIEGRVDLKIKHIEDEGRAVRRFVARRLARSAKPIEAHPTYRRIVQLLGQPPNSPVSDDSHRILAMIERARVSGITPLEAGLRIDWQRPDRPSGGDTNIGVAILNGEAYFYRRGHHRLAIAKALGIPEVPVDILLWDSEFNNFRESARINLLATLGIHQSPSA